MPEVSRYSKALRKVNFSFFRSLKDRKKNPQNNIGDLIYKEFYLLLSSAGVAVSVSSGKTKAESSTVGLSSILSIVMG